MNTDFKPSFDKAIERLLKEYKEVKEEIAKLEIEEDLLHSRICRVSSRKASLGFVLDDLEETINQLRGF